MARVKRKTSMTTSVVLACGVAVVLLALFFFYYTRRASRRRHQQQQQQSPTLSSMSPDALGFTNGTANYDNSNKHPFNGPSSGTTRVSRYQKGKTNLDFTEARDSEWQWHQLGHMHVCNSLQTDRQIPHHSLLYRPYALPAAQTTASKH